MHLFVEARPKYPLGQAAHIVKSLSAGEIFQQFPWLSEQLRDGEVWGGPYFVRSVGDQDRGEIVRWYIGRQPDQTEQFKLWDWAAQSQAAWGGVPYSQKRGMAATTRDAIAHSSGDYIYRAESDDACDVCALERMVQVLEAHPQVGFPYWRAFHMDEDGNPRGGRRQGKEGFVCKDTDFFPSLAVGNFIPGPNIVLSCLWTGFSPNTLASNRMLFGAFRSGTTPKRALAKLCGA